MIAKKVPVPPVPVTEAGIIGKNPVVLTVPVMNRNRWDNLPLDRAFLSKISASKLF
jgi:hypothetical protein